MNKIFSIILICIGLLLLSVLTRPYTLIYFVIFIISLILFYWVRNKKIVIVSLTMTLLTLFVPLGVQKADYPIAHRVVPYVSGMPSQAGIEKAKRGEIYLTGSCLFSGFEPSWVILY